MSELHLIGLSGKLRSGKDTFADHLVEEYGYQKVNFSDPIFDAALQLNPVVDTEDGKLIRFSDAVESYGKTKAKLMPEVRSTLQKVGDLGREFSKEYWVGKVDEIVCDYLQQSSKVVLSGVRMPAEFEMVKRLRGSTVNVRRNQEVTSADSHITENALEAYKFDYQITNNRTIEQFKETIDLFMQFNS